MKKAPCLLCYGLETRKTYGDDYGYCWKKEHRIHKPIQNCALFSLIGPHAFPDHPDQLRRIGEKLIQIADEKMQLFNERYEELSQVTHEERSKEVK